MVRVQFPQRNMTLAYYNDRFDLHCGDLVYVDGKLEGKRGRVVDVNYNFRINLADYKRVIGVADTNVSGRFTLAGSHVLTFDRAALPRRKVMSWYKAPSKPDTEYACGSDDSTFPLRELHRMRVDVAVAERGYAYYAENRVRYLCLDGMKGYALVEGTEPYDVEFVYSDGMIYALTCSCYCVGNCKHEVAAMMQLREMLAPRNTPVPAMSPLSAGKPSLLTPSMGRRQGRSLFEPRSLLRKRTRRGTIKYPQI